MEDTTGAHVVQPLLVPGAIYDRASILANLGISDNTFDRWQEGGLQVSQPDTKKQFVLADDVIAFIKARRKKRKDR